MHTSEYAHGTWELVKGKHSLLDSDMLQVDFLCKADLLERLAAHEQARILGNGVANGFGHKWYSS